MLEGLTPAKNRSVYCKIEQLLATLEKNDSAILIAALADTYNWSAKGLSNALRQRNLSVADTTIAKHRNRACACYRD